MRLSVLDLLMVRSGQSTSDAVRASHELALLADRLGYTRFWVAEHHNMPAVASTAPSVLIPYLAAGTEQIRFGSGGVMLPNHTATVVAEQFALLEAMLPGRIDLGIGRAPGSDPVTSYLVRGGRTEGAEDFDTDVTLLTHLLGIAGAPGDATRLTIAGHVLDVQATPRATTSPDLWLLGSSGYSAQLAADRGLPYVFANHFGMPGIEDALALYRQSYQPSARYPEPRTILPVNVAVHPEADVAEELVQPQLINMALLRTGSPLLPLRTLEEARAHAWTPAQREVADRMRERYFVGTPAGVAAALLARADELGVDEVMVAPIWGASEAEDPASPGSRARTLELLAAELL